MSAITNTFQTFQSKGNREDLTNRIYDISPEDTPFMSSARRGQASSVYHEWQTDSLAAASTTNAQIQGDDVSSFDEVTPTVRIGNYTQIMRKTAIVARTTERVSRAGRGREMSYQLAKKTAELKRDMEATLLTNQGASAGNSSTASKFGSFLAFLTSNVNMSSTSAANPSYTTTPTGTRTDGTARVFTEAMLKDVMQQAWDEGATPRFLFVGGFNKVKASAFSGVATKTFNRDAEKPTAIIGAADVYVSDFGRLSIVPNRFQRGRDALLVDPSMVTLAYLDGFQTETLAKTGDAEKKMLLAELTLKVHNEKAHGIVADLTTA